MKKLSTQWTVISTNTIASGIIIILFFLNFPLCAQGDNPPLSTDTQPTITPTSSSNAFEYSAKDYFQHMVTGFKYQYESIFTKSQKIMAEYSKKSNMRSLREIEFVRSEKLNDGSVKAIFKHVEYSLSDSMPSTFVNNVLTYLVSDESIKNVTDLDSGNIYEEGFDLKIPQQGHPVTWINVFHGDLSNIGGEHYEIEKSYKAYFGKCETPYGVYPDCIIVEEIDPGSEKDTLTRTYYARSIGRVKDEYFNRGKKKLRVDTAKALYGKSWKLEMNLHNKNLMKWVDDGTCVLEKISETPK